MPRLPAVTPSYDYVVACAAVCHAVALLLEELLASCITVAVGQLHLQHPV